MNTPTNRLCSCQWCCWEGGSTLGGGQLGEKGSEGGDKERDTVSC